MKKSLGQSLLWSLSAEALHTVEYKTNYSRALDFVIKNKKAKILDTAAGTGFPTFDLARLGYENLAVSDLDGEAVNRLKSSSDCPEKLSFFQSRWQDLSRNISEKFDAIINSDNSFVYMDGWLGGEHVEGVEAVIKKSGEVLQNFFDITAPGGMVIVGLGKHYTPSAGQSAFCRNFELTKDGEHYKIEWTGDLDWDKRVQTWTTKIESESFLDSFVRTSYLLTKEELVAQMLGIGFKNVYIVEPNDTRDNLIVGLR